MESPVMLDKPPEYNNNGEGDRGFPFDEEDAAGAWSNLASRHPEIAARIRNRPQNWARKRRPQDGTEQDFGEGFFEEIPPEFREHFPNHWNRQGSQSQPPTSPQQNQPPQQQVPKHVTIATQTDPPPDAIDPSIAIPCHDVPKPAPPQPIFVDAEERNQSSTPAPPEQPNMSSQQAPQQEQPANDQHSNVRHIPIFVEGRDEPVINKNAHFTESKPSFQHPPQSEREQYFQDEPDGFHHPPNFSRPFNSPFSKGFRQTPQPFAQHMYPQAAFARSNSPRRSQSPKAHPAHEEPFVKVPVHHEQTAQPEQNQPRPQSRQQQQQPQQQQPQQQQSQQPQQQQRQQSPQPKPQPPPSNDPITQILSIQTDVLNLMGDVEKFNGTKKDKQYMYLDEMLTRNLIKLDTIETEGKENIRLARKEAIKCIQKCIAVLEAKAEKGPEAQPDVEMNSAPEQTENGEIDMKETKDEQIAQVANTEASSEPAAADTRPQDKPEIVEPPKEEKKTKKKIFKKRDKSKEQKGEVKDAMQVDANVENSPSMEVDGTVPSQ